jgi:pyruvate kinase
MAPLSKPEITSNIQWVAQMNVDVEPTHGRKTSIIGTIGNTFVIITRVYS